KRLDQPEAERAGPAVWDRRQRLLRCQAEPRLFGRRLLSGGWPRRQLTLVLRCGVKRLDRSEAGRQAVPGLQPLWPEPCAVAVRFGQRRRASVLSSLAAGAARWGLQSGRQGPWRLRL